MMRVSSAIVSSEQARIWDWVGDRDLVSVAQARPYVGLFFEEAARLTLGATRHQIDSTADYCPDLSLGAERFLECKAVGATGQGLVFSDRLKRDGRLVREGAQLTYLFWCHSVRVEDCRTLFELRAALAAGVRHVLAVPFESLRRAVRGLREVCLLTTGESTRMGYRLPKALLEELAGGRSIMLPKRTVYGCEVRPVPLFARDAGRCLPLLTQAEREAAGQLLYELSVARLEVGLSEAPEPKHRGHMVREVMNRNPSWYRRLCERYTKKRGKLNPKTGERRKTRKRQGKRHHDTDIRRPFVERALERLNDGASPRFDYDFRVLPIVRAAANC